MEALRTTFNRHIIQKTEKKIFKNTEVLICKAKYRKLAIKECILMLDEKQNMNIQFNTSFNITKLL